VREIRDERHAYLSVELLGRQGRRSDRPAFLVRANCGCKTGSVGVGVSISVGVNAFGRCSGLAAPAVKQCSESHDDEDDA